MILAKKLGLLVMAGVFSASLLARSGGNDVAVEPAHSEANGQETVPDQKSAEEGEEVPVEAYSLEGVWDCEGEKMALDNKYYRTVNGVPGLYEATPSADDPNKGNIAFNFYTDDRSAGEYELTAETLAIKFENGTTLEWTRVSDDPKSFTTNVQKLKVGKEFENADLAILFSETGWADEVSYTDSSDTTWLFGSDEEGTTYLMAAATLDNFMSSAISSSTNYEACVLLNGNSFASVEVASPQGTLTDSMSSSINYFLARISDKKKDDIKSAVLYVTFERASEEMEAYTFSLDLI